MPARRLLVAACIAVMFEGACLGLGEGDLRWPFTASAGGAVTVAIQVTMMTDSKKWLSTKKSAPHGAPRPDILSPWRRLLSLPIPCHVHWPRSCCQSRARTAAICKKACFRGPTACMLGRVCSGRSCVRGARVRCGCAAGAWAAAWVRGGGAWRRGWAAYVGRVPLTAAQAHVGVVRAGAWGAGRRGVFPSAGSSMRGHLGCCGVWWLFRGFCSGGHLGHSAAAVWGKGTGNVPNLAYDQGGQELGVSAGGCRASLEKPAPRS
jgi:hypothetical protein